MLSNYFLELLSFFAYAFDNRPPTALPGDLWASLNESLNGRLFTARPLAEPCFVHTVINGECQDAIAAYSSPSLTVSRYSGSMWPQWASCIKTEETCLLDSVDPNNSVAWTDKTCSQGSISQYYVDVRSASDVQSAFQFARDTGVLLSIKNTGHDFKGAEYMKGSLGLWTHNLKKVSFNPRFIPVGSPEKPQPVITMGAGVLWDDAYRFADEHDVTLIGGYHTTVGASGGWLMGGGHSVLSPVYGLGVDRVLEFKVVTPDGVLRTANAYENGELFWALRGGGGGTFGVVLESTVKVEPKLTLQVAVLKLPNTTSSVEFLRLVIKNSHRWAKEGWGGHTMATSLINVTPLLSNAEARESLAEIEAFVESQNGTVIIEEMPSWMTFFEKYVKALQVGTGVQFVGGSRLIPTELFESESGREQLLAVFEHQLESGGNTYIVNAAPYLLDYVEGSTSVTPAWRKSLWHWTYLAQYPYNATVPQIVNFYASITDVIQEMRDITPGSGTYFAESEVFEPNHEESFWGDNYSTLLALKRRYDPHGILDCWQCVGWGGGKDTKFSCYPH